MAFHVSPYRSCSRDVTDVQTKPTLSVLMVRSLLRLWVSASWSRALVLTETKFTSGCSQMFSHTQLALAGEPHPRVYPCAPAECVTKCIPKVGHA